MNTRPNARRSGFTLLEVLIAMSLFTVLYAIAVPNLQAMRAPYALESAAYEVAAHLNVARQRAIARNARYRMVFTSTGYHMEREASPNTFVLDSRTFPVPHEVTIGSASPSNPIYNSRGMLTGNVTVSLSVQGTGTKTVTINVLGQATVS